MSDLNTEIKIGADASGVEAGVGKAKRSLKDLGDAAQKAGKDAGAGIGSIGAGGDKAAKDVERATKSMQGSLQRLLAEQKAGAKGSREYYEALADTRGISRNAIKPILDQIDAAKSKTLQAKTAADSWAASLGKVGPLVAAAFSGAAITGFLGKVVSVQREFDVLNSSLKTVTGSSAAAEREMAWLKDFAKETPFGLAQATQGFVKMKALGLDPTRAALTSFGNTASAMGKDLNQMIEAVADASTGEFERLKEFGIKAKKEGDNVSLTFQGVTTTIKNSASEITKYLEDIGNTSFGGAMEERAKTLDGTIAALGDTWDELFRTVSANNVGSLIFDSVTLANGALEDATTILRAMGGAAQDASRDTGALSTIQNGIATVFETVAVLGANLKYVLVQIGNEIGGLAAQVAQAAQFNFSGVAAIRQAMVADAEAARKEIDATTERILRARKAQEEYARYATRNASAATDPRRIDLGTSSAPTAATRAGARATKEALSEYDKLMQRLGVDLPKAAAAAEAAQHGYNKSQEEFIALAGSPVWAGFTNQQRAQVAALFENRIASEQAADAAKTLSKANADAAQARERYLTSLASGVDKIKADTAAQIEATSRLGMSKEAIADLDAAKLEMLATDLELQAIKAMDRNLDEQTYNALKQQAEAYRELAAAKKAGATKEMALDLEKANRDAAKKAADEWERAADDINRSLTDALMRGFESGKDFAKNMRDTVTNMFKTLVLRPTISAVMSPVAGAINGMLYGNAAAAAGGGANALGMLGSGANLINGLQGTQGMLGTVGGWLGLNTVAANTGLAATIGIDAASAAAAANAAGAAGGGLLSGVGAALPWIGGIAALASILGGLDDSGTYHTGGAAQYSAATGLRTSLGFRDNEEGLPSYNPNDNIDNQFGTGFGYVERGDQTISAVSGIAQALGTALDGVAVSFGQKAGYEIATAFADDTSEDGAWGALRISKDGQELLNWQDTRTSRWAPKEFGDGEGGYKEYLAAVAKDTRQVLLDMDLPSWADKMLESIGDAANMDQLAATVQQIGAIQTTFVQLGKTMEGFAGLTDKAFEALMKASGGIESLAANAGTYYENFYSEAEKTAAVTRSVSDALAQVGLAMPTTRDEFRALVESQLSLGESGAGAVAALLGVSGAFASVVPAAEEASTAIGEILSEAMKRLQADSASLQIELMRAQGNTTGAGAAQRAIDTSGMSAAEVAIYDYNQSLRDQIEALDAAAAEVARQADTRAGLERQILELQGDTAAIRQLEIAGMDAVNVALYDRVQALQAEAQAAEAAAQAAKTLADSRFGLENRLLAQSGQSGFVQQRIDQRDLAELTKGLPEEQAAKVREQFEANLKLRDQYEANQLAADNLAKAMEEMERQQNAAAQAQRSMLQSTVQSAQNAVSQLKSIFDTLDSSIASLRGSVTSAAEQDSRAAREYIAQASVLMRSGSVVDSGKLSAAVHSATAGIDNQSFANSNEADFERLKLAGELAGLKDSTAGQLTVAEQHLSIAESQLAALEYIASSISSLAGAQQAAAGQPRDQWATVSGQQVYASSGGAVGLNNGSDTDIYGKDGSRFTGSKAIAFVRNQIAVNDEASVYAEATKTGISAKALDELMGWAAGTSNDWAKANKLPQFAIGTNYVPRDMVAQIHEGEAIVPKAFNPWANGSTGGDNTALIAELRALRAEVAELRNAAEETAGATGATADVLVRVTQNGNGMVPAAAPI